MNRLYLIDKQISDFQKKIWEFYGKNKRDLPWRSTIDPYEIFISEVMLQQTQVERVMSKYHAFIKEFPDFRSLAHASIHSVLKLWQGLGYNRRALHLQRSAQIISQHYNNVLPQDPKMLDGLPGIGEATASSLVVFSYNLPFSFIETNIRRVYIHFFFPQKKEVRDTAILLLVERTMDKKNPREWYWALMDYGTMLGKTIDNPNRRSVHYQKQPKFKESNRELRGKILKYLIEKGPTIKEKLTKDLKESHERIEKIVADLKKEGLIKIERNRLLV